MSLPAVTPTGRAPQPQAAGGRRRGVPPRLLAAVIAAPVTVWQLLFFAAPLAFLLMITFWEVRSFRLEPAFVATNWSKVLNSGPFYNALLHTLKIAGINTALALLIAFPAAYQIALKTSPRVRAILTACLVVPVFSSYLLRVYAWQIVLSPQGLVNAVLMPLGLPELPLLGGALSLQIGLLTLTLPVVTLVLVFGLAGLDRTLLEAAQNMGCRPQAVIRHVVIPGIRPAIILACTTGFLLAFGDYVSPVFMAGSRPPTLSILIVDTVKSGSQWPRASVIGVCMLLVLTLTFLIAPLLNARRKG
jgi:ABC-type spermidine/putrescine transport system permease subunit I